MENRPDEKKLTTMILSGDQDAFRILVELYQNFILNTCYRFILNREDAEDTAQEVFVEVYRSISKFEGKSKLSTWIYRIAVNKSLDFLRKEKRKKRSSELKTSLDSQNNFRSDFSDKGKNPEENLELSQDIHILKESINRLPENQRVVFTLSKYDGISNKEIAEIMGTTLSSVESLMHRAKINLRKKLFSHFKKEMGKGKKFLILIFFIIFSQFPDTILKSSIFRIVSDIPQVFEQNIVTISDRGLE